MKRCRGGARPAKTATRSGFKVGVTLYIREGQQSLWENGIFQNCYFLLELLARLPSVSQTFIVNGGPGNPATSRDLLALAPAPVINMQEAAETLDLVIELSAQVSIEWATAFVRRGGKVVGMHVASDFIIDAERMAYKLAPGVLMAPIPYHEVWTLPAFEKTCAEYYRVGFNAPARVMPHLWAPTLLEQSLAVRGNGAAFAYDPGRKRWRLGVLEPNLCTVKTCHLPLLISDVAHRADGQMIESLKVFNALVLKDHPQFIAYARSMDLVRQGLATFEGRFPIFDIMGKMCDAVVSHHWENGQNYLYYEMLYGGYPLIHNSDFLGQCGYRYASFDPEDGALALRSAFAEHDLRLDEYRSDAAAFLATLDPLAPANIATFGQAIERVCVGKAAA